MNQKYSFKKSTFVSGIDAQTAGEELERIRSRDGYLMTHTVVDEARPEDAPLHPAFEWNDNEAAEKYRNWQARALIKSVQVINEETEQSSPMFVHVSLPSESSRPVNYYQSVSVAANSPDEWQAAVNGVQHKMAILSASFDALMRAANEQQRPKAERARRVVARAESVINRLDATA